MGKKECLCEDGKASHDALYERFIKEVDEDEDDVERKSRVEGAIKLLKQLKLTADVDARDLENILHFVTYNPEVVFDEATILLLVCSCKRNSWQMVTPEDASDKPYEDYVMGPSCTEHIVCYAGQLGIIDNFIDMVTDDSC